MKTPLTIAVWLGAVLCALSQNLIVNGDFEAGNTNFSNDYSYAPGDMYPQGRYCVVSNPASVHGYWTSFRDHTSGAGLMLVANGDSNPTNVAWRQTISIATNTTYLFSAWAASAYYENPSRFFFFINGQQQGNPVALPGTTGLWQNYSVAWDSGPSVTAVLEIRMLTTEYGGNDFVLDDLSFRSVTSTVQGPRLFIKAAGTSVAVELSWSSLTNQLYQVLWTSRVPTNQWFSLGPPVAGNGGTNSLLDARGSNSMRFYTIVPVD